MSSPPRRWPQRVLLVLAAALTAGAIVAGHLNRNVIDGPTFAAHVDSVRRDPEVATQLGRKISAQVLAVNPDLVAIKPLIDAVSIQIAGGDLLSGPTRRAAATANQVLTESDADAVVLRIADVGALVAGVIGAIAPDRAPQAGSISVTLAAVGSQAYASTTIALARWVDVLAWLLPLLALLCLAGAVLTVAGAQARWAMVARCGFALGAGAGAVGLGLVIGGFAVRRVDDSTLTGAVVRAGWGAFMRPMWWSVLAVAAAGAALGVASGSSVPESIRARSMRIGARVWRPASTAGVVVRAIAAVVVGVVAVADPAAMVELAMLAAGAALVVFGLAEASQVAARARGVAAPAEPSAPRGQVGRRLLGGLAVVALVVGVVWMARPGDDVAVAATGPGTGEVCNGHAELCDRPFDEVAFASSHNSMAVATEPGWFIGEHTYPIRTQLDDGVRALLIDVWSGQPAGSVVRTAPGSYDEALAIANEELGADVVAAALRVADAIAGVASGPEARYLCHGLCEIGSTPFLGMLEDLRSWMAVNPDEVVTLFIEDHVDVSLIAADIESVGLADSAHTPVAGQPWPTLGEMIRSGRRLVVMAETGNGGTQAPWLVNGFEFTQDTPYSFRTVDDFSCVPNRGPADAPLFLLNHWLSGFGSLVTNAQQANTPEVLGGRAQQCRTERGQIPNFVAVNYVDIGALYSVVDELNGVG